MPYITDRWVFQRFFRKANMMRESRADDITKLLQFFTYCKQQNPQFFCDFQLDGEGKILSLFWSHASQQGEYADFGDALTFDTTYKTNMYKKPLACLWVLIIICNGPSLHLACLVMRQRTCSSGFLIPS
jgi:hypothetical protein